MGKTATLRNYRVRNRVARRLAKRRREFARVNRKLMLMREPELITSSVLSPSIQEITVQQDLLGSVIYEYRINTIQDIPNQFWRPKALKKTFHTAFTYRRETVKRKQHKKKSNIAIFFKKSFLLFLLTINALIFTGVSSGAFTLSYLQSRAEVAPEVPDLYAEVPLATDIYDRNGVLLFRLHGDDSNSDKVDIHEINALTLAAFIAAEDSEFYNHPGVDTVAIARCTIRAFSSDKKCGGSTITQQLVKIMTKRTEPTFERKVDEVLMAHQVEEAYTKDEILELYLNVTPYGSNLTGIKTAAKFYFGIENLQELSLPQAVSLAAIINDPVHLSPTFSTDQESAKVELAERESYVYSQLREKSDSINKQLMQEGKIDLPVLSEEIISGAEGIEVAFQTPIIDIKAGHFVNYALQKLQEGGYLNGVPFTLEELQRGGYQIYTSLDYTLQEIAERYVYSAGNDMKYWNVYNAAVMTTIPSTGEILTMAGSKSYFGENEVCDANGENCKYNPEVNVLTSLQSPGSTNKPLGYYLAYAQGLLSPGSFLPDIPIAFGDYYPKNWDGGYYGVKNATARRMLQSSRNIPALIVMHMIGVENYINTARSFGYTTYADTANYGKSLILGGGDVLPVEHAQAYGVFANGGNRVDLNPIKKILDRNGNVVYEATFQPVQVADPAAVYLLNQTLYNLDTGTGLRIGWDNRDIAGKTGTTENNKDAFLVMYSPDFVTLGWAGNNNNDPLDFSYGWPAFVVAPWLTSYMAEVTGSTPYFGDRNAFYKPDNVYYNGDWVIAGREPKSGVAVTYADFTTVVGTDEEGKQIVQSGKKPVYKYVMPAPDLQRFLDAYVGGFAASL